jgi:hypothetical protein
MTQEVVYLLHLPPLSHCRAVPHHWDAIITDEWRPIAHGGRRPILIPLLDSYSYIPVVESLMAGR